jgi:hypothetical protein
VGLDMYLETEVFVSQYFGPGDEDERKARQAKAIAFCAELGMPLDPDSHSGVTISLPSGYWRKANHIHAWFVRKVQDGIDECQRSEVSTEQLKELRDLCREVLDGSVVDDAKPTQVGTVYHKGEGTDEVTITPIVEGVQHVLNTELAESLLPTQGGFFFGGTDYNEYYLQDLENTIAICDRVIAAADEYPGLAIYYRASW